MQLLSTCIILCVTLLDALRTGAAPINPQAGVLTLPIRSLHHQAYRNMSNPQFLQQTLNRAYHRVSLLSGRAPHTPSSIVERALHSVNSPDAPSSIGLQIDNIDTGYIATIQLGTPPRDFNVLMDSGSSDLWVGSEICQEQKTGASCGNHTFLGPRSSSSFINTTQPWNITYGTGFVSGAIIKENVVVAGLALKEVKLGIAEVESRDFTGASFDGLMGLAQSGLSNQRVATPVEALASGGHIPEAVVSYKISRTADHLNDGEITFGGLDPTKFDVNTLVTVNNVSPAGFWQADMDDVSVEGKSLKLGARDTILDTGTTLMFGPKADVEALHNLINGAKFDGQTFTVPCDLKESVALTFGARAFTIDPRDVALPGGNNNVCMSGIQTGPVDDNGKTWLVGDVFLKNAYFSTNVNRNTLSLAKLL